MGKFEDLTTVVQARARALQIQKRINEATCQFAGVDVPVSPAQIQAAKDERDAQIALVKDAASRL